MRGDIQYLCLEGQSAIKEDQAYCDVLDRDFGMQGSCVAGNTRGLRSKETALYIPTSPCLAPTQGARRASAMTTTTPIMNQCLRAAATSRETREEEDREGEEGPILAGS